MRATSKQDYFPMAQLIIMLHIKLLCLIGSKRKRSEFSKAMPLNKLP